MRTLKPKELDRINHVNSGLMLVSAALAYLFPFHTFFLSFVILGPLHYLTEISWLHEKKYFTSGRWDFVVLAGLALLDTYSKNLGIGDWTISQQTIRIAAYASLAMVFLQDWRVRLGGIGAAFLLSFIPIGGGQDLFFSLFLSTIVHVYVLTWMFVLHGALKAKSRSGYVSLAVHSVLGLGLLLAPPVWGGPISETLAGNLRSLGSLHRQLARVLGWDLEGSGPLSAMQFVAFAYTYHYLNWFSKTRLIQWHRVSRQRLAFLGGLYAIFVGLYVYDFKVGLVSLLALSLGHVLLEFPLNVRTAVGIVQEIKHRLPAAAPSKPRRRKTRRAA